MPENVPEIMYTKMKKVNIISFLMELLPHQETDTEKIVIQISV